MGAVSERRGPPPRSQAGTTPPRSYSGFRLGAGGRGHGGAPGLPRRDQERWRHAWEVRPSREFRSAGTASPQDARGPGPAGAGRARHGCLRDDEPSPLLGHHDTVVAQHVHRLDGGRPRHVPLFGQVAAGRDGLAGSEITCGDAGPKRLSDLLVLQNSHGFLYLARWTGPPVHTILRACRISNWLPL